jgi:hypothetical protein
MTRRHRRWHLWLWLVLTPLLAAGLSLALASRHTPIPEQHAEKKGTHP